MLEVGFVMRDLFCYPFFHKWLPVILKLSIECWMLPKETHFSVLRMAWIELRSCCIEQSVACKAKSTPFQKLLLASIVAICLLLFGEIRNLHFCCDRNRSPTNSKTEQVSFNNTEACEEIITKILLHLTCN